MLAKYDKLIKKFFKSLSLFKKNIQYLTPVSYCLIFAMIVVSFHWEYYIVSIYFLITIIYLTFFSKILPCEKCEALRLQNLIDEADYEEIVTNIPVVVTVLLFSGIGVYYGFLIAKFYLFTLVAMMITRYLGYKVATFFPFGIKVFKSIRKDIVVLRYHWYTHFKNLRDINHINIITLLTSLVLGSLFAGNICSEDAFNLNYMLWHYLLGFHCVFVVSIDVYILFFMNMRPSAAFVSTCIKCFVGVNSVLYCNYNLAESGLGPQTPMVNKIRPFFNNPQAHDCESIKIYKAMKAAFSLIDDTEYLIKRPDNVLPSWLGGASAQTYEVHKSAVWDLARTQDVTELARLNPKDQKLLRVENLVNSSKANQISK